MREYPKRIRKALRELKMEAHEREIAEHLEKLWLKFQEWREGKIGAGELSVLIHEYDTGPSRKMFSFYNDLDPDLCVASAVAEGRIKPEEISSEVLQAIQPRIDVWKNLSRE
jgi:hypothetical protein